MCGIFGYTGKRNSVETVLKGLKKLEYRGYDSAGIAGLHTGEIVSCKEVGKIAALEKLVHEEKIELDLAIAQTRWATHGKPSVVNAHPHLDQGRTLALVHNGIIENHDSLRISLEKQGIHFVSETDTEVIAQLLGVMYQGDFLATLREAIPLLKGAFALAIIHKDYPGQIFAIAHESPLVIGIGHGEAFVSSDSNAFAAHTREVVFLANSEIAVIKSDSLQIFDLMGEIDKETHQLTEEIQEISKGDYEHYTLKEIFEQPRVIRQALLSRFLEEYGTATFEELNLDVNSLLSVQRILILACGTSLHSGLIGASLLEDQARILTYTDISSEFRYKNPIVPPDTLVIAISQSGETADTIAAVKEVKAKGAKVLAICNVYGSTLTREADSTLYLRAGPEIGVCSTKAYTSQVIVLALFSLMMARMRHMNKYEGQEFLNALKALPDVVQAVLDKAPEIEKIAKKYAHYENFFFIGRRYMYPSSLEGALKLKEISYINANGYAAGEMKHGPIALINADCPTVALGANSDTLDKLESNLREVAARDGKIIAIIKESDRGLEKIANDVITIPDTIDELATVPVTVVTQLLAYYIAIERGADIDQPRNLAKSVTVE